MRTEASRKPAGAAADLIAHGLLARIDDAPFLDTP